MNRRDHYPQRTLTLLPGDMITATYIQPTNSPFTAQTLKRLFGWKNNARYVGHIRRDAPTRGKSPDLTTVADFYDEKGKFQSTHVVYNVELMIAKGELREVQYRPNPQPQLFDDEP